MNTKDQEQWYDLRHGKHRLFCKKMEHLIEELVSSNDIHVHSITSRVKEKNSFLKKCELKQYQHMEEITDIVGVRIITPILEDVDKVCELIKKEFTIDDGNSGDKLAALKSNEMGYLSVHYIAQLGSSRENLPEYCQYKSIVFEIQVRTLLQHAWAEITHDSSYKFSGTLPSEIDRHFHLAAGTLELIDREFQRLSDELSTYKNNVVHDIQEGKLQIEINSTSLKEYLAEKLSDDMITDRHFNGYDEIIIQELRDFDIDTIKALDLIVSPMLEKHTRRLANKTYLGFLRDTMIISDAETYFKNSWKRDWVVLSSDDYDALKALGVDVEGIVARYDLDIFDNKLSQ